MKLCIASSANTSGVLTGAESRFPSSDASVKRLPYWRPSRQKHKFPNLTAAMPIGLAMPREQPRLSPPRPSLLEPIEPTPQQNSPQPPLPANGEVPAHYLRGPPEPWRPFVNENGIIAGPWGR
jgi:hypothetical protein